MNKKLLICGLIATGLALSACVKKETPQEDEQTQVDTDEQQSGSEPVEFKPLETAASIPEPEVPAKVAIIREESSNSATEMRRETQDSATTEAQKVETAPQQSTPTTKSNNEPQTEDDAVAAAIAAATPALEK